MTIFLIRHGHAGSRPAWSGSDALRPLSDKGQFQAEAAARELADCPITRILSSPAVRCVQTVRPLALRLSIEVEPDARLFEGSAFEPLLDLLAELPDDSVLCSHGDVIPTLLDALIRRGLTVEEAHKTRKGSRWEIKRKGTAPVSARFVAPPEFQRLSR